MKGVLRLALLFLLLLPVRALAQSRQSLPTEDKGTYLGVLVSPVPELLYNHVSELPRGEGVVISHILPDSPAARAGLHRHDILLRFDTEKIRDGEHLARLINEHKPEQKVALVLLRSGKPIRADATLTLGPVLKIAASGTVPEYSEPPKASAKSGGPPPEVSVSAVPLEGGRVKLTIEYYPEGLGRVRAVTCDGTPDEIAGKVQELALPVRVRELTRVAVERIRDLDFEKPKPRPRR